MKAQPSDRYGNPFGISAKATPAMANSVAHFGTASVGKLAQGSLASHSVGHMQACRSPCASHATPCVTHSSPLTRRSEEHTSELQSRENLVCRLLLEKKKIQ